MTGHELTAVGLIRQPRPPLGRPTTGITMTVTVNTLGSVLALEFALASHELAEARAQQRRKDTPAHRAAVTEVLARIDAVLDMHLDVVGLRLRDAERADLVRSAS